MAIESRSQFTRFEKELDIFLSDKNNLTRNTSGAMHASLQLPAVSCVIRNHDNKTSDVNKSTLLVPYCHFGGAMFLSVLLY